MGSKMNNEVAKAISNLSIAVDRLDQEINSKKIKVGDYIKIITSGYGTAPEDVGIMAMVVSTDAHIRKVSMYELEIDADKKGNNDRYVGIQGVQKVTPEEYLNYLVGKAGIKIGDAFELGHYRFTSWNSGEWSRTYNTCKYIVQGFCFEEGYPCVYSEFNGYKFVRKIKSMTKFQEFIIPIGKSNHKITINKSGIENEEGVLCSIQDLKNLIYPPNFKKYQVQVSTLNIGCVENVTIEQILEILDKAKIVGLK